VLHPCCTEKIVQHKNAQKGAAFIVIDEITPGDLQRRPTNSGRLQDFENIRIMLERTSGTEGDRTYELHFRKPLLNPEE
jgi:hypothetical protein